MLLSGGRLLAAYQEGRSRSEDAVGVGQKSAAAITQVEREMGSWPQTRGSASAGMARVEEGWKSWERLARRSIAW